MKNNSNAFFDENIFLYCEDTELCYRLYKKNLKRVLIDGPKIIHLEGGSNTHKKVNKVEYYKSISSIYGKLSTAYFVNKHYNNPFLLFILKLLYSILWLSPLLIKSNKKYLKLLWKK